MRAAGAGGSGAPPSIGRIDALDGIRAIAILGVLGWHASDQLLRGGHLGVTVFFTLSGFLITTLLLDEHRATGRLDLRRFYRRRAARLAPALVLAVAASGALAAARPSLSTPRHTVVSVLATLTYTSNVVASISRNAITDALSWSWSLSLEEQFYLLWPALFLLAMRSRRGRRALVWGTVALYALLSVWRVVLAGGLHPTFRSRVYYGPDTRVDAVIVGCLLALYVHWWSRRDRAIEDGPLDGRQLGGGTAPMLAVPAFVLLLSLFAVGGPAPWLLLADLQLAPLLTAAVVIGVLAAEDGLVRTMLSWRPLVWLGRRSYGVYLWNVALRYLMPAAVSAHWLGWGIFAWLAVTLTVAHLSYRYVEQPFLRRVSSSVGRAPATPAAPAAAPLLTPRAVPSAAGP